jgi:hypothetical protein
MEDDLTKDGLVSPNSQTDLVIFKGHIEGNSLKSRLASQLTEPNYSIQLKCWGCKIQE